MKVKIQSIQLTFSESPFIEGGETFKSMSEANTFLWNANLEKKARGPKGGYDKTDFLITFAAGKPTGDATTSARKLKRSRII